MGFFIMSLNLRGLANTMIVAINENHDATIKVSTGFTVSPDGTQIPSYEEYQRKLQLQSVPSSDLEHFGFANQQSLYMYAYGDDFFEILDRQHGKGNAIVETVKYSDNTIHVWQVIKNAEPWFKWSKALLQLIEKKPL